MSTGAVIAIAVAVVVVLAVVFLATTSMRRDQAAAIGVLSRETRKRDRSEQGLEAVAPPEAPPTTSREVERAAVLERRGGGVVAIPTEAPPPARPAPGPIDPETYGQTRRQFLNRGILAAFVAGLGGFGAACVAFLWPPPAAGFGGKITIGTITDIERQLASKQPFYSSGARSYVNPFPTDAASLAKAAKVYSPSVLKGMQQGYVVLYQKCAHLGCRVPWCQSSQWFECPCHGSKYDRVGEYKSGPAPQGLYHFVFSIQGGSIVVDTSQALLGAPRGTDSTGQGLEGPHCV
jgi:cytochrome b6-f complex iron-sulfur subunit